MKVSFNFFIILKSSLCIYLDTLSPLGTAHFSIKESMKSTSKARHVTRIAALIIIGGDINLIR